MDNQTAERVLVKYCCNECELTFLVDQKNVILGNRFFGLTCPFCSETAEAVAHSNPEDDIEDILDGCLWPS